MSNVCNEKILDEVAQYYSDKLATHGQVPQGVDWNGEAGQILRFQQLCKLVNGDKHFSLNDVGCGYGALYNFLIQQYPDFSYTGIDISGDMIEAASQRLMNNNNAHFIVSNEPDQIADYGIASGIFNVRMSRTNDEWISYLESTLDILDKTSRLGFAFNCLTSYSDLDKMRDYLYYADPSMLFELCKRRYSRNVALLHDYELYEFTILVRKRT